MLVNETNKHAVVSYFTNRQGSLAVVKSPEAPNMLCDALYVRTLSWTLGWTVLGSLSMKAS